MSESATENDLVANSFEAKHILWRELYKLLKFIGLAHLITEPPEPEEEKRNPNCLY